MPVRLAALYRVFRVLDVLLLAIALLGVVIWLPDHSGAAVGVVAVWAFGVAEYANYFVARLAYPLRRWPFEVGKLRRPPTCARPAFGAVIPAMKPAFAATAKFDAGSECIRKDRFCPPRNEASMSFFTE